MKLRSDSPVAKANGWEKQRHVHGRLLGCLKAKAHAAAVAAALLISPLAEGPAHAQDANPQAASSGESRSDSGARAFSGRVSQDTTVLSMQYRELVIDGQAYPSTNAILNVWAVDQNGVEFTVALRSDVSSPPAEPIWFSVGYDGTTGGNDSILGPLGISGMRVSSATGGEAQVDFTYADPSATPVSRPAEPAAPAVPRQDVEATAEPPHEERVDYRDRSLSYFSDEVDIAGMERTFTLNNRWDIGGNFYSNEGGQAIWGSIRYAHRTPESRPFNVRIDAGNIWFGRQEAPYVRLFMRPELSVWRLRGVYYGSVATMGYMPSYLYTSHALGIGYSQPIGDNVRLRMGFVTGGALSYPAFDDIYFQMTGGLSLEFYNFLLYGLVNSYFAAPDPMKTAYVGYYSPHFQNAEFGAQYRFLENQYTVRLYGDYGLLNSGLGVRVTRSMTISDSVSGDFWISGGATHWDEVVGSRWDARVAAGIRLVFGGEHINSTNTAEFDHSGRGGTEEVAAERPNGENPGPYGYGRSGNPLVDDQINLARERILDADRFSDFSSSYSSASTNEKIMAARFLGAFLQQVAYSNGAMEALYSTDFFNSEVQRIANSSTDSMFGLIQQYVHFYDTHAPGDPLPENLRNGIAICAGIHHIMAEFLRANGIPTIVASVNTINGPHVIAIARPEGSTVLLDYGNAYSAPENSVDEVMRYYGQYRRAPTFQSQMFTQDGYFTTYITAEGRLMRRTAGLDLVHALRTDFLGVQ